MAPASGRSPLSRQEVIDAALELVRQVGFDGLTMRGLSEKLGVTPMAAYYHVGDKDALLRELAEEVRAQWIPLRLGPEGWQESLRRHLLSMWQEMHRHPGLGVYMMRTLPDMGRTTDATAAFFRQAGFEEPTATLAASFVLTYVLGRWSVDARLSQTRRQTRARPGLRAQDHVEFSIGAMIAGLEALRSSSLSEGASA